MVSPALICPGLDVVAAAADNSRLARRCKRALHREIPECSLLELTAAALGIASPPAAALARFADGLNAENRHWFRADAVALVPDRDGARIMTLDEAPLDDAEMQTLCAAASAHFGERLALERSASGRWYAALADVEEADSQSPRGASGETITLAALAQGRDAQRLRNFLNELQMLWFEHPVNLARRAQGRPQANALWLWGGGRLPARPVLPEPIVIYANAPELAALAEWLGLHTKPLGEAALVPFGKGVVVAVDDVEGACYEGWLDVFVALKSAWRLYTGGNEWRFPARRRFFPWPG